MLGIEVAMLGNQSAALVKQRQVTKFLQGPRRPEGFLCKLPSFCFVSVVKKSFDGVDDVVHLTELLFLCAWGVSRIL